MAELVLVAAVCGVEFYGTQAEADAASLNPGDAVAYLRRGEEERHNGIVDFTWWYDSVVVKIKDGPDLHPDCGDEIERLVPERLKK